MEEEASTGEQKEAANVVAALDEGQTAEPGLRSLADAGALHMQDSAETNCQAFSVAQVPPVTGPPGRSQATLPPATKAPAPKPSTHASDSAQTPAAGTPYTHSSQGMATVHGLPDSKLPVMEEASTGENTEAGLRGLADAGDAPPGSLPCEEVVRGAVHVQDSAVTDCEAFSVAQVPPVTGPPGRSQATLPPATKAPAPKPSTHASDSAQTPAAGTPYTHSSQGMATVHGLPDSKLPAMEEASTGENAEAGLRGLADAGDAPPGSLHCEEVVRGAVHLQDSTGIGNEDGRSQVFGFLVLGACRSD